MFCSLLQDQPAQWGFLRGKMKMTKKDSSSGFQLWGFSQRLSALGFKGAASQIGSVGNGSDPSTVLERPLEVGVCTGLNPCASSVPALSPACLFPG